MSHLVDPSFQGVNRLFVSSFENEDDRRSHWNYYLPKVQIKDYVRINGKNVFHQPINNDFKAYENIWKIANRLGDEYTTGFLLDYPYFKENRLQYIAIDLSKQQTLATDPRAIQQINFTANLNRAGKTTIFFIVEEAKETVLDFSQRTAKVL